ncbi:MAG TPA: hypothetical protein VJH94_00635 [Candidatus Paceibacterota bacterium]
MVKVALIGFGMINKAVKAKIDQMSGWVVETVIRKSSLGEQHSFHMSDIAFLAIPTENGGDTARQYIAQSLAMGIPIVTCEKGALSHHFDKFLRNFDKLGYSATVGGGTRLLPSLRERLNGRKDVIVHGVVNGTLNFIFSAMDNDSDSLGAAVKKAMKLGYAEPGAESALDVLNGEMMDTVMKTAIIYNTCMRLGKSMNAGDVKIVALDSKNLARLVREVSVRRYVVSFLPQSKDGEEDSADIIGGFSYSIDGWKIRAGFVRTDSDPLFRSRLPAGANNCIITCEGVGGEDGIYVLANGPGAGPEPTASSMMSDARKLLRL